MEAHIDSPAILHRISAIVKMAGKVQSGMDATANVQCKLIEAAVAIARKKNYNAYPNDSSGSSDRRISIPYSNSGWQRIMKPAMIKQQKVNITLQFCTMARNIVYPIK